jgi:L-histidine N-alpha-methyltransferase
MTDIQTFARDIHKGLSAPQKHISSKYFYDDIGSGIFQDIMKMPEYYPTPCEFEILSLQGGQIIQKLKFGEPFQIVEFGAGDGIKTRQLLKKLVERQVDFTYVPIDISSKAIDELTTNMRSHLPELKISPMIGNYFSMMEELAASGVPSLLLFLGGNIGNYEAQEVTSLLADFRRCMNPGDYLLTGFDLQKIPPRFAVRTTTRAASQKHSISICYTGSTGSWAGHSKPTSSTFTRITIPSMAK